MSKEARIDIDFNNRLPWFIRRWIVKRLKRVRIQDGSKWAEFVREE